MTASTFVGSTQVADFAKGEDGERRFSPLLTSTQVAAQLGVSTASIYKLATAKQLPAPDSVHGTIKLWGSEKVEQIRQQIASKVDRRVHRPARQSA